MDSNPLFNAFSKKASKSLSGKTLEFDLESAGKSSTDLGQECELIVKGRITSVSNSGKAQLSIDEVMPYEEKTEAQVAPTIYVRTQEEHG